jgi:hypothetical protein
LNGTSSTKSNSNPETNGESIETYQILSANDIGPVNETEYGLTEEEIAIATEREIAMQV